LSVDDDGADDPDADFSSIQQALEVLPEYWDIEVHPGRYVGTGNEVVNIDSRGRGTRIVAVAGPEFTVIDGEGARCGVRCLGDLPEEGSNAWDNVAIEGFSIVNGSAPSGGGVLTSGTRLFLKDCILADNAATWIGGGLLNSTNSPVILSSCQILRNRANTWYGGGISCKGDLTMRDCEIIDNIAHSWSGGVQVGTGEVDIRDCRFSGNRGMSGAALGIDHGTGTVVNCEFMGNIASYIAGAVFASSSAVEIRDSRISGNTSWLSGSFDVDQGGSISLESVRVCSNEPNQSGPWEDRGGNYVAAECCDSDISGDLVVGDTDLLDLVGSWDSCNSCAADIDRSGTLDITDLLMMLADWGPCPGI
jgi:predicted outer membrane repeat protein